MKNIWDNSENFTSASTISAGYYMMEQEMKAMEAIKTTSGIDAMIDHATGYNPFHIHYKNILKIIEDMLPAAKHLQEPCTIRNLEEMKDRVQTFLKIPPTIETNNLSNN